MAPTTATSRLYRFNPVTAAGAESREQPPANKRPNDAENDDEYEPLSALVDNLAANEGGKQTQYDLSQKRQTAPPLQSDQVLSGGDAVALKPDLLFSVRQCARARPQGKVVRQKTISDSFSRP
jgi:hypothetical protein